MLYRGQAYGEPIGEWWTTSEKEADKFGMSRGGNRTYVVLAFDEDPSEGWLDQFLYARRADEGSSEERCDWYRIPIAELGARWRGVRIKGGSIEIG